jgi:hypothetical protein
MPHAVTHTVGLGFYSKTCAASQLVHQFAADELENFSENKT